MLMQRLRSTPVTEPKFWLRTERMTAYTHVH